MKKIHVSPALGWFLILIFAAFLWWISPFAYERWADAGLVLHMVSVYVILPALSILLPYFGGTRGLHPMAGFFPMGLALLFSMHWDLPGFAFLCMGLSLVACVAGNEVKNRREKDCGQRKKR